jgi:glycine oxidase
MDDCCIIGGGVVGLSIARELAGRGLAVRVLTRDPARGTTSWAAAGIFPPAPERPNAPPGEALTAWSDRLHWQWAAELLAETGIDTGLAKCGGLHVAAAGPALAALDRAAEDWRAINARCERLVGAAVAALEPTLAGAVASGAIATGLLLPDETQIRPPRHLEALARSCAARGVALVPNAVVHGIRREGRRIDRLAATIDGREESVRAGSYVLAAGAWSEGLAADLGLRIATTPIRGQIMLLRQPAATLGRVLNRGLDYLVPRPDGRLLVGSTLEDAGFDAATTPAAIDRLQGVARELLGEAAAGLPVEATWAGLRPGSADGLPTIGRIPGLDDAFVAAGHFRAGWHQSPGTAVIVADLVTGRRPPLDPAAFAPDRTPVVGHRESVAALLARARG